MFLPRYSSRTTPRWHRLLYSRVDAFHQYARQPFTVAAYHHESPLAVFDEDDTEADTPCAICPFDKSIDMPILEARREMHYADYELKS